MSFMQMKELLAKLLDDDEDMKDLNLTAKHADMAARNTQSKQASWCRIPLLPRSPHCLSVTSLSPGHAD